MRWFALVLALVLAGLTFSAAAREVRSLDGTWKIAFDPENVARAEGWHRAEVFNALESSREIKVPSCWELIEKDYEGAAVYAKSFHVSKAWSEKTVRLRFDAVNYIAEVWLNGYCVGRHEGGYGPFEFRVDDLLNYDAENVLSVRVVGPIIIQDKVVDGLGKNDAPHWRGAIAGGIWQSVALIAAGEVMIDDVFVTPDLASESARARVELNHTGLSRGSREVRVVVSGEDGVLAERAEIVDLKPGRNVFDWTLAVPGAKRWSPAEPNLLTASVNVADSDESSLRFGMREFTVRDNQFELNGEPIYVKAAFFEGLYPFDLATPENEAIARREIQLAKDAGFNMIRPWRKPPPPMWLDLCDEMGVLVVGGFPIECMNNWPTVTPNLRERIEHEVRAGITRDRSRACVVQWEIFNEIYREDLGRMKHDVSLLARRLDPSRLILDESGGFAGGSNIYPPYALEPIAFNDVHIYPGAPLGPDGYDHFLALSRTEEEIRETGISVPANFSRSVIQPGLLTYVSEIGYGSLPNLVANNRRFAEEGNPLAPAVRYHRELAESYRAALKASGMDAVYPDLETFCLDQQRIHGEGNKLMIEAIRCNPKTRGYAVHALTDGDWVVGAGLLDLFRDPKPALYEATKSANADLYLALRPLPRNIHAEKGARLRVTGVNDGAPFAGTLHLAITDQTGDEMLVKEIAFKSPSGVDAPVEVELDTSKWSGAYTVAARWVAEGGEIRATNETTLHVFAEKDLARKARSVAVVDSRNALRPFLTASGFAVSDFGADAPLDTPVLVAENSGSKALTSFAKRGGTVVYLDPARMKNPPVRFGTRGAKGLWVGVAHVVRDHPVFAGLPSNGMMDQIYENVWARETLSGLKTEPIVASVTHSHYPMKRHAPAYTGPEAAWWGTDLGVVNAGAGRHVFSALRLVEHLGNDPVAEKILFNLIEFAGSPAR